MGMKSITARLRNHIRNFAAARDGNIAMIFALASLAVVGLMGAAVDYSRANAVKADLQSALDAAALMVSKSAPTMTNAQLQSAAKAYFEALFKNSEAGSALITATYDADKSTVTLSGATNVKSDFLGIMGSHFANLPVTGNASVSWGSSRLRVALALDNTGSMASNNKMAALKTAAKNLLTQLQSAAQKNGDVYVSIVPFAKDVNVGKHNYNQPWIRWDLWDVANPAPGGGNGTFTGSVCMNGTLWLINGWSWSEGGSCTGQSPGICYQGQIWNWNGSTFVATGTCGNHANHNTWNGCVTDRDQDWDATASNTNPAQTVTLFPAEQYGDCPVELMPLSYKWNKLKAKIDTMQPDGNTNVTIGLVWGWQTLLTDGPFAAPAEDPKYKYNKVLILLTDGDNTQNRFTSSQAAIDARTKKACDNAKAAGVTIYTVLVMEGSQSLLQACASDAKKYFYLQSASGLVTAFNQIGTDLTNLHVSK